MIRGRIFSGMIGFRPESHQICFEPGFGAYQGLAQKVKVPFLGVLCFCSSEGSRAKTKPAPNPGTHQSPVETLSEVRVTGRKSELRTKSRRYNRADPQNPNRNGQKRAPNGFRCFCRNPPPQAFLKPTFVNPLLSRKDRRSIYLGSGRGRKSMEWLLMFGVAPANQTKERPVHELFTGAFRNKSSFREFRVCQQLTYGVVSEGGFAASLRKFCGKFAETTFYCARKGCGNSAEILRKIFCNDPFPNNPISELLSLFS